MTSGSGGGSGGQGWTWGYRQRQLFAGQRRRRPNGFERGADAGRSRQYGSSAYDPELLPSGTGPGAISGAITNAVDPQATPSPASVLDQTGPVASLPSLATPASLVDAIWGMGNVADPGYRGMNVSAAANDLVDTLIAPATVPRRCRRSSRRRCRARDGVFGLAIQNPFL